MSLTHKIEEPDMRISLTLTVSGIYNYTKLILKNYGDEKESRLGFGIKREGHLVRGLLQKIRPKADFGAAA